MHLQNIAVEGALYLYSSALLRGKQFRTPSTGGSIHGFGFEPRNFGAPQASSGTSGQPSMIGFIPNTTVDGNQKSQGQPPFGWC